jgi:hypothetical protein
MKQEIGILHGMGVQIPMATLNSCVKSVWVQNSDLTGRASHDPNIRCTLGGVVACFENSGVDNAAY